MINNLQELEDILTAAARGADHEHEINELAGSALAPHAKAYSSDASPEDIADWIELDLDDMCREGYSLRQMARALNRMHDFCPEPEPTPSIAARTIAAVRRLLGIA